MRLFHSYLNAPIIDAPECTRSTMAEEQEAIKYGPAGRRRRAQQPSYHCR